MTAKLLIGFTEESSLVDKVIAKKNLPHAILLSGPESIGKRRFARSIASKIFLHLGIEKNSLKPNNILDKIHSQVFQGSYPDLFLIDAEEGKSNISVDQIRDVIQNFNLKPYYDQGAVIVINDAHKMTISAANALLKALEEPENDKYFILITHQEHLIPETINSRTQTFSCCKRTHEDVRNIIKSLSPNEEISIPERLIDLLDGSLALLNLSEKIETKNLQPKSENGLVEIIIAKIFELEDYLKRIDTILALEPKLNLKSQLIQFLRTNEKDPDIVNIKINLLARSIRDLMKSGYHQNLENLANTVFELSQAQNDIQVRHLDAEIRLTNTIF